MFQVQQSLIAILLIVQYILVVVASTILKLTCCYASSDWHFRTGDVPLLCAVTHLYVPLLILHEKIVLSAVAFLRFHDEPKAGSEDALARA